MIRTIVFLLAAFSFSPAQAQLGAAGAEYFSRDTLRAVFSQGYAAPSPLTPASMASADMDGDGIEDLILGWPGIVLFNPSQNSAAGGVSFLYGSNSGLSRSTSRQFFLEPIGEVNAGERFGIAVATGNIDGQGPTLAVGASGDRVGANIAGGSASVIYSNQSGLILSSAEIWSQESPDIIGGAETNDLFGRVVAMGDFNANGFDDLLVTMPWEDIGDISRAGAFTVINGISAGLVSDANQFIDQDSENVPGSPEAGDQFGHSAAVGNFNCDFYDDAAIGAPLEDIGDVEDAGAVAIFYGSPLGFFHNDIANPRRVDNWHQDTDGVIGSVETGDEFGDSLAVGDFDGDGCDDLAIGVSSEDVDSNSVSDGGAVAVLYGSASGLNASRDQFFTESNISAPFSAQANALFGATLTTADFDSDGHDDLATASTGSPGRVTLIFGSPSGLDGDRVKVLTSELLGTNCGGSLRAESMTAGDWNNDNFPDLAVGVDSGLHLIYSGDIVFSDRFQTVSGSPCF